MGDMHGPGFSVKRAGTGRNLVLPGRAPGCATKGNSPRQGPRLTPFPNSSPGAQSRVKNSATSVNSLHSSDYYEPRLETKGAPPLPIPRSETLEGEAFCPSPDGSTAASKSERWSRNGDVWDEDVPSCPRPKKRPLPDEVPLPENPE